MDNGVIVVPRQEERRTTPALESVEIEHFLTLRAPQCALLGTWCVLSFFSAGVHLLVVAPCSGRLTSSAFDFLFERYISMYKGLFFP